MILVTGGAGYIGSHTIVELQNSGFDVLVVDDLSNSDIEVFDGIEKITGRKPVVEIFNLCDIDKVEELFNKYHIEGIIHFAASKAVGESVEKPLMYYRNNLVSLINILDTMISNGVNNIIFSSSCTVYGQADTLPVTESTPVKMAESPYGNTKQISEEVMNDATVAHMNLKVISLRYFNPVGAHESGLIGELPRGIPQNLMPFITQTAIGLREKVRIFGSDYTTPDGTAIRDYIHVTDLARAHISALNRLIENKNKSRMEYFNVGTGNGYSVLEVIESFKRSTGMAPNFEIVDRRAGDIEQIWADTTLANNELGWKAELGIDEMTASAWKWQQNIGS
ncbi:UDP-glucose 4-epimerase GalE [Bacteroidota bacterium]